MTVDDEMFTLCVESDQHTASVTLPCHLNVQDFTFLGTVRIVGTSPYDEEAWTVIYFSHESLKERRVMQALFGDEVWVNVVRAVFDCEVSDIKVSPATFYQIVERIRSDAELVAVSGGDFQDDFDMRRGHPRLRRV